MAAKQMKFGSDARVEIDGQKLVIVRESDILGVLE